MTEIASRLSTALADRYAIEREIGAGGMATVYVAEDLKHDRKVAVKVAHSRTRGRGGRAKERGDELGRRSGTLDPKVAG